MYILANYEKYFVKWVESHLQLQKWGSHCVVDEDEVCNLCMERSWINVHYMLVKSMKNELMNSCNLLAKMKNLSMKHIIVHVFVVWIRYLMILGRYIITYLCDMTLRNIRYSNFVNNIRFWRREGRLLEEIIHYVNEENFGKEHVYDYLKFDLEQQLYPV